MQVRKDLINKELENNRGLIYHNFNPSRTFIERLLNYYYCHEFTEHYYDSEPDVDDYISDMAFMYDHCSEEDINDDGNHFTKKYIKETYDKDYTKEEAKRCSQENHRLYKEYLNSERRLTFNNWIEVFAEGIWRMSRHKVDEVVKDTLNTLYKKPHKDRWYMAKGKDGYVWIYVYNRDEGCDYWFIMNKRNRRVK